MTRKWLIASVLAAVLVFAFLYILITQAIQPKLSSYALINLSGTEAADLLLGHLSPGSVEGWNDHAVFVRGSSADHDTAAALLKREDKPTPQVALRFQIIEANGFASTDTTIGQVVGVLRGLFRFQGYRLAAEAFLRTKEFSEARQMVIGQDGVEYVIDLKVGDVTRREGKASAEITTTLWFGRNAPVLNTSVQVPDGQTVVLGTARPDAKRGALILVVTPEIR